MADILLLNFMNGETCSMPSAGLVGAKMEKPKGWMVLTDSEKIERLREIVKQKSYWESRVYTLERQIQKLRELLVEHFHSNNKVVSAINKYDSLDCSKAECSAGSNQKPEEVYF